MSPSFSALSIFASMSALRAALKPSLRAAGDAEVRCHSAASSSSRSPDLTSESTYAFAASTTASFSFAACLF